MIYSRYIILLCFLFTKNSTLFAQTAVEWNNKGKLAYTQKNYK